MSQSQVAAEQTHRRLCLQLHPYQEGFMIPNPNVRASDTLASAGQANGPPSIGRASVLSQSRCRLHMYLAYVATSTRHAGLSHQPGPGFQSQPQIEVQNKIHFVLLSELLGSHDNTRGRKSSNYLRSDHQRPLLEPTITTQVFQRPHHALHHRGQQRFLRIHH